MRQKQSAPLPGTVGDLIGERFITPHCARGHGTRLDPKILADRYGRDLRIEDLRRRGRCSTCGERIVSFTFLPDCAQYRNDLIGGSHGIGSRVMADGVGIEPTDPLS